MVIIEHANCQTVTNVTEEHAFFSTLQLLQFNVFSADKQYKIQFKPDMFRVPNKKGLEVVLHFLLTKLDPERSKEEFVGCWPAYDVKRSHLFRKNVFNWLTELNRDYVEGVQIPRINNSTLTKASGGLVVSMLERLAALVLSTHITGQHKERSKVGPVFSPSKPHLNLAAATTLRLEIEVLKRKVAARAEETHLLRGKWTQSAKNVSDEIQNLSKKKKKLEMKKDSLETRQKDYITAFSTDKKFIKTLSIADEDALRTDVQQKSLQVKQHLHRLGDVCKRRVAERAVVNSLINGSYGDNVLHHDKIALQVPSIIIQEYQKKLAEGTIGNTYCGGDLCLVALTKISYIGLKMLCKSVETDTIKSQVPQSILQQRRTDLAENLGLIKDLGSWLEDLDLETRGLRADMWLSQPDFSLYQQDIRLQSPMPVFSLAGGPARTDNFVHVAPLTPKPKPQRPTALTPLSLRKYKQVSSRMSNLSTNVEEKTREDISDIENQENDPVENINFTRRENVWSKELNDLSLLDMDASANFSFLN
ncbi:HAUS augmin-like complex subunit 6 [Bolinopsis microptera]|uniref:HAUS augmin-like complex subunit 6 n=1 Tax=Bolinopsis microptera TaxID=2820187 RepID=UPI00307A9EE3